MFDVQWGHLMTHAAVGMWKDNDRACGPRIYTFFLYLSDVEEGGETPFGSVSLRQKAISLIVFKDSIYIFLHIFASPCGDMWCRHVQIPIEVQPHQL